MIRYSRLPQPPLTRDIAAALISHTLRKRDRRGDLSDRLQSMLGCEHLYFTRSGREALLLALQLTDPDKPEVIVPAYGCPIVSATVRAAGKVPVYADIDPTTFHPSGQQVLEQLSERTSAIVLVHEFGLPVRKETLNSVASAFPGPIIEDAAIALTAGYADGTPVGTIGDLTVLSGSIGKPVGAGSWGALIVRSQRWTPTSALTESSGARSLLRVLAVRLLRSPILYNLARQTIRNQSREDAVEIPDGVSASSRFDDALMRLSLTRAAGIQRERSKVAARLSGALRNMGFDTMDAGNHRVTFSRLPFYSPKGLGAESAVGAFEQAGIELARPYRLNFSGASAERYLNAHEAIERVLALTLKDSLDQSTETRFLRCAASLANADATHGNR